MRIDQTKTWLKTKAEAIPFSTLTELSALSWDSKDMPKQDPKIERKLFFTENTDEPIELILLIDKDSGAEYPNLLPAKRGIYLPIHKAEFILEHLCDGSISRAEALLRELSLGSTAAEIGLTNKSRNASELDDLELQERVRQSLLNLRATEIAKELLLEEKAEKDQKLEVLDLAEWLETEDQVPTYRIEGLWPSDGNVHLIASYKSGKTTLVLNVIRSLVEGEVLLGRFPVRPVEGRVLYINYELSDLMTKRWFRRIGIKNRRKVSVLNLRGQENPLGSKMDREKFAKLLRDLMIEVIVIDPFSGAFTNGNSLDNDEVKQFLIEIDKFANKAGIKEVLIAVHAGYEPLKPRGASTLGDHPDALWYIWKPDKKSNQRNFMANGRDIDVEEEAILFDETSLSLSLSGSSGRDATEYRIRQEIINLIRKTPGCSASQIESSITGAKALVTKMREQLKADGLIREQRAGKSKIFFLAPDQDAPPSPLYIRGEIEWMICPDCGTPPENIKGSRWETVCLECGRLFDQDSAIVVSIPREDIYG